MALQQRPRSLALARVKHVRLVGLSDACQLPRLHSLGQRQEAVAPAKCGTGRDFKLFGGFDDDQPLLQHCSLRQPFAFVPQPRQWRAGQGIEGLAAIAAFVALQPVGLPIAHNVPALAVRTDGLRPHTPFEG